MSTDPIRLLPPTATPPVKPVVAVSARTAPAPSTPESTPAGSQPLEQAVEALNRHLATSRTDLKFEINQDAHRVVVSVVDAQNGKVLRQIPSEEALRIARYLEHDQLGLVRQRA